MGDRRLSESRFAETLRELESRQPEVMPEPSLDRISEVVRLLDQPQLTYPTIHVTGTNGKTTMARLVTALSCAHGLSTGTFVSPHVEQVTERFSVCADEMTPDEFVEEHDHLRPYLEQVDAFGRRLTYFEVLTAMAYLWFADRPVQLGVFEVGMGGTWDATNLVRGDVAVLCPIGLDHPQLGSTVAEVAGEKAGIIKEGRTAVVRTQRPQALAVIERRAASVGATLALEGDAFGLARRSPGVGGQSIEVAGLHGRYSELFVAMFGEDNARGAAAAVAACESLLGRALDEEAVREALSAADSPGRMEVVSRRPVVVLDGAHNPDAMKSLAAALAEAFRWRRLHLVVAMFDDKDVEGALAFIAPLVGRAYVCSNSSPRAADPDRVAEALGASGVREIERFDGVRAALTAARTEAHEEDLILVTGSFYTVGDARPLFPRPSRPPRRSEDNR